MKSATIFLEHFYRSYNNQYAFRQELTKDVGNNILSERNGISGNVKEYIRNKLNPKKHKILNPLNKNYDKVQNIPDILQDLNRTEDQYYDALLVSNDHDIQIYLKQQSNAHFINNFFKESLQAWQANIYTASL